MEFCTPTAIFRNGPYLASLTKLLCPPPDYCLFFLINYIWFVAWYPSAFNSIWKSVILFLEVHSIESTLNVLGASYMQNNPVVVCPLIGEKLRVQLSWASAASHVAGQSSGLCPQHHINSGVMHTYNTSTQGEGRRIGSPPYTVCSRPVWST